MTPKVRKILDDIDEILCKVDVDSRELWAVLTALRGPDEAGSFYPKSRVICDLLKSRGTVPIRCAAFPKTAIAVQKYGGLADFDENPPMSKEIANQSLHQNGHFQHHVNLAFKALGLEFSDK